ncbi:hypothetical protein ACM66B_006378 [Microbotryomycetes sp. NB124-2]
MSGEQPDVVGKAVHSTAADDKARDDTELAAAATTTARASQPADSNDSDSALAPNQGGQGAAIAQSEGASDDSSSGSHSLNASSAATATAQPVTNLRKVTLLRRPASAMASSTPARAQTSAAQRLQDLNGSHSTLHRASSESRLGSAQAHDNPAQTVDEQQQQQWDDGTQTASLQGNEKDPTTQQADSGPSTLEHDQPGEARPPSLDQVLLTALGHSRDRIFLLRAETEMERFVASESATRLPLSPPYFPPNLNSYQRLLLHRLADVFGIIREVEAAPVASWAITPGAASPGMVVLVKSDRTRMPERKLAEHVPPPTVGDNIVVASSTSSSPLRIHSGASTPPQVATASVASPTVGVSSGPSDTTSQPPQILRILPRSGPPRSTSSNSSSAGGADEDSRTSRSRKDMTLEEREAAYREARERIFNQPDEPKSSNLAESPTSTTSPAVITRPSSAASTLSRSSAALSVSGRAPPSEASFSSVHSGFQGGSAYGPSGSTSMAPFGPPYPRPSAPSFDLSGQTPSWSSGYMYSEVHEQYAGQTYVYQQQQAFSTGPNAPPVHSMPYPHPSLAAFPPYGYAHGDTTHQQQQQQQSWSRSQPLPSPALSASSVGSSQHCPSSTPSERGSTNSAYLMRFPDGGVVGMSTSGSRTASGGSSSTGGVGGPFSSSVSVASTRSNSSGHVPHRVPIKRTSYSASQSVNSVMGNTSSVTDEEGSTRLSSGEVSERASVKSDDNDDGDERKDDGNLQSVSGTIKAKAHPSLPAKPTWVSSRQSSGGNSVATTTSKKSRASSFGSASAASEDCAMSTSSGGGGQQQKPFVRGPAPPERMASSGPGSVAAWQQTSLGAGQQQQSPYHVGERRDPVVTDSQFRRAHAWSAMPQHPPPPPPPPPFVGGPYTHPSVPYPHPAFSIAPVMLPAAQASGVTPGYNGTGLPYPLAATSLDPIMSGPELRRPPPKSTALFDPNKPRGSGDRRDRPSATGAAGRNGTRGGFNGAPVTSGNVKSRGPSLNIQGLSLG